MLGRESKSCVRTPWGPIWSLLWRALIIGPILMPFGLLFFVAILASILAPPLYVVRLLIDGHYFAGPVVFVVWLGWLRFGFRLLRWTMQGMEYSSI